MTNFTTKMMIAATTLMVAAGCASAQTLKAEIPFNFRVADKVLPAGTYQLSNVHMLSGNPVFRIAGSEGTVMALPKSAGDAKHAWTAAHQPVLSFECVESRCSLAQVYTGTGASAYNISHPKAGAGEPVRMATIVMHTDKAD
jgi:hypothetical protein